MTTGSEQNRWNQTTNHHRTGSCILYFAVEPIPVLMWLNCELTRHSHSRGHGNLLVHSTCVVGKSSCTRSKGSETRCIYGAYDHFQVHVFQKTDFSGVTPFFRWTTSYSQTIAKNCIEIWRLVSLDRFATNGRNFWVGPRSHCSLGQLVFVP